MLLKAVAGGAGLIVNVAELTELFVMPDAVACAFTVALAASVIGAVYGIDGAEPSVLYTSFAPGVAEAMVTVTEPV